jgi:hypothetical protein
MGLRQTDVEQVFPDRIAYRRLVWSIASAEPRKAAAIIVVLRPQRISVKSRKQQFGGKAMSREIRLNLQSLGF